jgi:hypothetical protein
VEGGDVRVSLRLRLVGWAVQPVVLTDDGETLMPLPVGGTQILAADWQAFKDGGDEAAIAAIREQIESRTPAPGTGTV